MPDLKLTPQEKRIVDYHNNTVKSKQIGRDDEGRPVTVYSTGVEMESGPYKGKFASVPGYIDGKIRDEDTTKEYWRTEINKGKWPIYNSGKELNKRSQEIHQIMDEDTEKAKGYKKGGTIRGNGIEKRGKTKGRFV